MKRRRNFWVRSLPLGLSLLAAVSCNKGLEEYSGNSGLYFAMSIRDASVNADTLYSEATPRPFVMTEKSDSVLNIRVKIIGDLADKDRYFQVGTIPEESTLLSGDCEPLKESYVVKAGQIYGQIDLHFHRTASLKGTERKLKIRLLPTSDFNLPMKVWKNGSKDYVSILEHEIVISDKYVQLPGFAEYAFGPFSEKKMELLLQLSGLEFSDFNEKFSTTYAKALGQKLDRYLKEQTAKGQPVLEEDGSPMTAGEYIYK